MSYLNQKKNLKLLLLATKRLKDADQSEYTSFEDVMKEFDITDDELDDLEDSVVIE